MEVSHPQRILVLGAPNSSILKFLEDLTGSAPPLPLPPSDNPSTEPSPAGLSHTHHIQTPYYTANVPVWIDELADPAAWQADFLLPEAAPVLKALGAVVVCFRGPVGEQDVASVEATLAAVSAVIQHGMAPHGWDGVCLAVAMPQSTVPHLERDFDDWEERCRAFGFEYVDTEMKGLNRFGEKTGIARVKEALETNEWEGDGGASAGYESDGESGGAKSISSDLNIEDEAEIERELAGLKMDLQRGGEEGEEEGDEVQIEQLQALVSKIQAVRDSSADLPDKEKKRVAAKAVREILDKLMT